jgi:hypothetical protein
MQVFAIAFALLAALHHAEGNYIDTGELFESYDYIVIGGGTAGATVASRLSENNGEVIIYLHHSMSLTMNFE